MTGTLFDFAVRGMKAQAEVNKLCRKSNPQTSYNAAEKMVKSGALAKQEQMVLAAIKIYIRFAWKTNYTFTTKNIAFCLSDRGMPYWKCYDICRKRFSGLRKKGKIERTGTRRDGCCVWRLK